MSDPDIIDVAVRVLNEKAPMPMEALVGIASVLAAVTPLIEAAALERAAKVAMDHPGGSYEVAVAIRALKK